MTLNMKIMSDTHLDVYHASVSARNCHVFNLNLANFPDRTIVNSLTLRVRVSVRVGARDGIYSYCAGLTINRRRFVHLD